MNILVRLNEKIQYFKACDEYVDMIKYRKLPVVFIGPIHKNNLMEMCDGIQARAT